MPVAKVRGSMNRTLEVSEQERASLSSRLLQLDKAIGVDGIIDSTICQDTLSVLDYLPNHFAQLIFIDPPYNLNKNFDGTGFKEMGLAEYQSWLETWFGKVVDKLSPNGSLYICGDWKSAAPLQMVLDKYLIIRNRITFEREKGRGAKANWKNCSEDIWFATKSKDYYFDTEAVKLKRKVLAPYRVNGQPKDWNEETDGNYRLTHPSNVWTDITIPFWSMPENTDHPTQKPEKLLAKIILASSKPGDIVFDPFMGSGTTSVVAKKLGRKYCGIEINKSYCLLAEKRLQLAETDPSIQGYANGVFWERNALSEIKRSSSALKSVNPQTQLC